MSVARRLIIAIAVATGLGILAGWVILRSGEPILRALTGRQNGKRVKAEHKPDIHPIVDEGPATASLSMEDALKSLDYVNDPCAIKTFSTVVQTRFRLGRYEELDRIADEFRKTKARFPGGSWKLYSFMEALEEYPGGKDSPEKDWEGYLDGFRRWMSQYPGSSAARVAYAKALTSYAWKARGSGWSSEVTEDGWRLFRNRLQQARRILEEATDRQQRCPMWYRAMQTIALGQEWSREEYEKLFKNAVAQEPLFSGYYTAKAYYLLPRWYGQEGEWETFATQSADQIGGAEGDAMYYYIVSSKREFFSYSKFFKNPRISWPRMKRGFSAIERLYGMNNKMLNDYCRATGAACDRAEALVVLDRLGRNLDMDVWYSQDNIDDFQDWAHCKGKYAGH